MKRAMRKERNGREELREKRIELSLPFFFSLRYICVSAVNGFTDIETINENCCQYSAGKMIADPFILRASSNDSTIDRAKCPAIRPLAFDSVRCDSLPARPGSFPPIRAELPRKTIFIRQENSGQENVRQENKR
jgi:hypothetical protein